MFRFGKNSDVLDRKMVFVTGAPRSGTSLLTKVLDAHPEMAILMENNFGNRRRHWMRSEAWKSEKALARSVCKTYSGIAEPVLGNKIGTPDVWWPEDILQFCRLFAGFKIVFIVRDPVQVIRSRYFREDYASEFNEPGRRNIMLDFRSRFLAYASSWRQSIEVYRQLKDAVSPDILCVYYDDMVADLETECRKMTRFIGLPYDDKMLRWHEVPHHDKDGVLKRDMKYTDAPVGEYTRLDEVIPESQEREFRQAMDTIQHEIRLYQAREL